MNAKVMCVAFVLALTTCAGDSTTPDLSAQQSNLEAQLATVRRAQTAMAEAIARAATAEAKQTRQAIATANAQATAEAKQTTQAQAARTATMQAYAFNLTATTDALTIARCGTDPTATAQAVEHKRAQAAQDAQAARRNAEFFSWFWPTLLVLVIVVMFIFGMYAVNQWVVVLTLRRTVPETRAGTLYFVRDGNAYAPQLLHAPMMLPATHYDNSTQAHVVDTEADLLKVNTPSGTTSIAKTDPHDAAVEANRRLATKLLRAAMQRVGG